VTEQATDHEPRAAASQPPSTSSWPRWLALVGALTGIGLGLGDRTIARVIADILPLRMTVSSAGTAYPAFAEAAPFMIRTMGLVILAGVAGGLIATRERVTALLRRHECVATWVALGLLLAGTAVLYGWLAYPHNAGPSNSRIHWVDIFYNRRDRFFYVLVKPFHMLFYEMPHVLQALNGVVNVALVYAIGARLFASRWIALLMSLSFAASGLMLGFANGAEDVMINVAFLLLVVLLAVRRSPLLGVGLFLVHLGRPPFILFAIAFAAAEILFSTPEGERVTLRGLLRGAVRNRYLTRTLAVTGGLFLLWHLSLWIAGVNWILANGRLFDVPSFDLQARSIDGFDIYPWSMTYTLHLLWIIPAPILLTNAAAALGLRRMKREDARLFVFIWLFVGAHLLMSEYISQLYFNVRYLTYLFPLTMITAWMALRIRRRDSAWRPVVAGLTVLLAASTLITSTEAFEFRRKLLGNSISQTFYDRAELRDLVGERPVATDLNLSSRNYLAYVLKRPLAEIHEVSTAGEFLDGALVFTADVRAYGDPEVLWTGRAISLVDPGP